MNKAPHGPHKFAKFWGGNANVACGSGFLNGKFPSERRAMIADASPRLCTNCTKVPQREKFRIEPIDTPGRNSRMRKRFRTKIFFVVHRVYTYKLWLMNGLLFIGLTRWTTV